MTIYPVIRIVLFFAAGILLRQLVVIHFLIFPSALLFTAAYYFISGKNRNCNNISSILMYLLFLIAGNITAEISFSGREFYPEGIEKENNFTAFGSVSSVNLLNNEGLRVEIITDSAKADSIMLHRKVILYCDIKTGKGNNIDSLYSVISPGNKISAAGIITAAGIYIFTAVFKLTRYCLAANKIVFSHHVF